MKHENNNSMDDYEWSIMHREDDPDPMEEYEWSIMSHLKDD